MLYTYLLFACLLLAAPACAWQSKLEEVSLSLLVQNALLLPALLGYRTAQAKHMQSFC